MMTATEKQISYLLSLVSRVTGERYGYISQARKELGLSSFQVQKLSKTMASQLIEEWKNKAESVDA